MQPKQLYDFADICVGRLGKLVGEMKQIGLANGLKEEEIKKVWKTCFEILVEKERLSRSLTSANLKQK